MAHIERKAKIKMLHERDMKKLQSQVVSKNVLDRKVALAAARDAEALAKAHRRPQLYQTILALEVAARTEDNDDARALHVALESADLNEVIHLQQKGRRPKRAHKSGLLVQQITRRTHTNALSTEHWAVGSGH